MAAVKVYFQVRDGVSLNPERLKEVLERKYGPLVLESVLVGQCDLENEVQSEKVQAMVAALEAGQDMPPVVLAPSTGGRYRVLDGNHRVAAAQQVGRSVVQAWVPQA